MEVKMDNTVDDQAFVLFDVSPLDFLNLFALVQSMTDSCSYFSMWRVFDTLSSRGFTIPTLRSRWSLSMGFLRDVAASRHSSNEFGSALDFATLLRFSLFEAAKKSVFYQTRTLFNL